MPKRETSNPNNGPSYSPRYRPNWIAAVICFVLGAWLTAALVDYEPIQSTFATTQTVGANLAGPWGANTSWILFYAIGASTWLLPLFLGWLLYVSIRNSKRLAGTRLLAMLVCIITLSGIVAMFESFHPSDYFPQGPGGWLGSLIYQGALRNTMGVFGAALLLGTLYLCGLLFIFTRDIGAEIERYISAFQAWRDARSKRKAERAEAKRLAKEERLKEKAELKAAAKAAKLAAKEAAKELKAKPKPMVVPETKEDPLAKSTARSTPPAPKAAAPAPEAPAPKLSSRKKAAPPPPAEEESGKPLELHIVKPEETKKARVSIPQSEDANYQFPELDLLTEQITEVAGNSEEEHRENAENLLRILEEFGVKVTLGEIHVGPVITRYEVVPAAGVRVEKISGLDKNIALGMRAQSVRILAPIPGKAAVGVEVPNQHPIPVGMREILESEDWAKSKAELPIALGKDVSGKPLISDLTKMPHLLIAGATGSGKSVCINSIVASILYSKSPQDVRLLMVDPKVVELKVFNTLPQMLIPVVTEPKKVPGALKWLLGEMEQRYQLFAKCNVRNILGYNSRKKNAKPDEVEAAAQAMLSGVDPAADGDDGTEMPERLPYIVAIIDELADLMMVAPAEIESSIARLAQLARAAGIHLIIATQRPSVNVITGVIKANLPSRIAFQVASQVDSRTILDGKGADTLIGRGDMLFSPPGSSRLVRAQGAFVSDEEVIGLVEALKVNGPPLYAAAVQEQIDRAANGDDDKSGGGGDDDDLGEDTELFERALDVLRSTKRASTSMIQRRLRIGYNRAARIMDMLEDRDIVGPENGSSPREILVDLDTYEKE